MDIRSAANANVLRRAYEFTPVWAVAWHFIPIANLFMPFKVINEMFIASQGPVDGRYGKGPSIILIWWIFNIASNIGSTIADRMGAFGTDELMWRPVEFAWLAAMVLGVISTLLFLWIIRRIAQMQSHRHLELADEF